MPADGLASYPTIGTTSATTSATTPIPRKGRSCWPSSARWRRSRITCGRITCSARATATALYKWGSTNVYLEGDDGQPIYNWTFMDLILDTILRHNCKPFVELGFMPLDLVDSGASTIEARIPQTSAYYQTTAGTARRRTMTEVARPGLQPGATLRRSLRRGRSGNLVLGAVERARHLLLARDDRGVQQALRLHRRRRSRRPVRRRASADRARPTPTSNATPASTWTASWITASTARTTSLARRAPRSISSPSTSRAAVTEPIRCTRSKIHHPSNRSSGT